MALSNTFKEPRREIIETIVGLIIFIPFAIIDYKITWWLLMWDPGDYNFGGALVASTGLLCLVILLFVIIHAIGDVICTKLEQAGFQIRPRQRY
ncbi:MAG TPA: hypothetical protein VNX68_13755 [Nitrosopumilaceae archaeon]|jgi:hypothetical protein|nr:hypothetical protein [Nitrosopumilaceae archaeon]